jgi:hypothetical protein
MAYMNWSRVISHPQQNTASAIAICALLVACAPRARHADAAPGPQSGATSPAPVQPTSTARAPTARPPEQRATTGPAQAPQQRADAPAAPTSPGIAEIRFADEFQFCSKKVIPTAGNRIVVTSVKLPKGFGGDPSKVRLQDYVWEYTTDGKTLETKPAFAVGDQLSLAANPSVKVQFWVNVDSGLAHCAAGPGQHITGTVVLSLLPEGLEAVRLNIRAVSLVSQVYDANGRPVPPDRVPAALQ